MEKYIHANTKHKTAGVVILTEKKKYFKTRSINKHKKDILKNFFMKGSIQQENITILNIDAPSNRAFKNMV